jgi:hypothetical protein
MIDTSSFDSAMSFVTLSVVINPAASMNSSQPWLSSASSATQPIFAVNSACDRARQAAR